MATKLYNCPVEATIDVVGGKWKVLILWHIKENNVVRFGQLKKLIPTITQKMLTQQLRELEKDHVIHRKVYTQVPPKVEYSLTEYGVTLEDSLKCLGDWGREHIDRTGAECVITKVCDI